MSGKKKKRTLEEARERVKKLRALIEKARYSYHVLDKPIMEDEVSDSLKHELYELEQQYPELITPDSPTQRIGGKPLDKFKKIHHDIPMLSLEDCFSLDELKSWNEKNERYLKHSLATDYYVELKIDGLAVSLVYEKGKFAFGATRGDGRVGEDVTQNLKTIEAIPLQLRKKSKFYDRASKGRFEVRGEVFMPSKSFEKLNKEQKEKGSALFANPRNAAAGSVRQLNSKITSDRDLDFVAYDIVTDIGQTKHEEEHEIAHDLGFKILAQNKLCKNLEEIERFKKHSEKNRKKLYFWIDGIVVVINDNKTFEKLGSIGKTPRGMIAYKFSPQEATTVLKKIILSVGRTGTVNPVAVLDPVEVAGTTVSRATLHNEDQIKKKDIRIGDTVVIYKAGDIIPEVLRSIKDLRPRNAKEFRMSKKCPQCGGKLIKKGAFWFCSKPHCFAIKRRQIQHFVSKNAFDIEGLGPQILHQLMEQGLIKTPADLFRLTESDLEPLERFAEKSAKNLVESIQAKRKVDLGRFLYALGIRHVGEQTAYDLANHFKTIQRLKEAKLEEIRKVPNIGDVVAQSVYEFFQGKENLDLVSNLQRKIRVIELSPIKGKLKGKTFCFTGTLESMSREEAKEKVRSLGGEPHSDIFEELDYLVVGTEPGSKLDRAKKMKIKTISEETFLKMIHPVK